MLHRDLDADESIILEWIFREIRCEGVHCASGLEQGIVTVLMDTVMYIQVTNQATNFLTT
jgi:hypothetical protein